MTKLDHFSLTFFYFWFKPVESLKIQLHLTQKTPSDIGNNTFCPPRLWTLLRTTRILDSGPAECTCIVITDCWGIERRGFALWRKEFCICKTTADYGTEDTRTCKTKADTWTAELRTCKAYRQIWIDRLHTCKNYSRHWKEELSMVCKTTADTGIEGLRTYKA